jgi:hypothetical protein
VDFSTIQSDTRDWERVSIPDRDFSGFQLVELPWAINNDGFQSLIGILVDFSMTYRNFSADHIYIEFQSLIGILVDFSLLQTSFHQLFGSFNP